MAEYNHHLKRLHHSKNSLDSHIPSLNHETIRESIRNFSISCNNPMKFSRPFQPAPNQARRGGGGGGRINDRHWSPSVSLPKRTIYYDLAESFVDHSTNPLSSDLYKIRFKHSAKNWPNGRFKNYKEKLDKSDGNIIDITCINTFPIVSKRKKIPETEQKTVDPTSSVILVDPIAQEQKKKLADKQTNFYANLFGCGKIPRLSSSTQMKKIDCISDESKSSSSNSLLGENKEDQPC